MWVKMQARLSMRSVFRVSILRVAIAVFLVVPSAGLSHAQGQAQGYPNRPVRIVVPFAPGGVTDVMARLLAQKLSENLGKEFFVDNRAGAGGNIGTGVAAAAPADGYTLVLTSSSYVINPAIHAKIPYDPEKDLTPVTISAVSCFACRLISTWCTSRSAEPGRRCNRRSPVTHRLRSRAFRPQCLW